ncbi:MAG: MaoC/PaaZ C-terminal domain-containing protein [Acidimicrobiales bacterium]
MARPTDTLGTESGPRFATVDVARAIAYAAATNDDNPAYASGRCAPPVFAAVATWESLLAALGDMVPAEAMSRIVHGEQDMHFLRPLVPGRGLVTRAWGFSVRPGRSGTRYTVRLTSVDANDAEPVLDQYVTLFARGLTGGQAIGPSAPGHAFAPADRSRPLGRHSVAVDEDQTLRYRDVSGDDNPIHLDDDAARGVGLPGRIVHGLCTMAMAGQSVLAVVSGGDPARLRRLAVRFADVVRPSTVLTTTVYDAGVVDGRHIHPFETHSVGRLVVSHGRAEIE